MISLKDIENLSKLARIRVTEDESKELKKDLEAILKYVDQIKSAEKILSKVSGKPKIYNVMREDGEPHISGENTDTILAEAPEIENGYIKVKKIL